MQTEATAGPSRGLAAAIGASGLAAPAALLLAATFHVAVTAHMAGDEIRIGLSDLMLPLLAAAFAWRGVSGAAIAPRIARDALICLAALSLWFTVALFIGRTEIGAWQAWALLNKYAGWYVLLAYFVLGACVAAEDRGTGKLLRPLLQVFIATACVISLAGFVRIVGAQMGLPEIGLLWNRQEGLLANPNAFGVIMATVWSLLAAFRREGGIFSPSLDQVAAGVAIAAALYSGSRSGYLGLVFAAATLLALRATDRRAVLRDLATAAVIMAAIAVLRFDYFKYLVALAVAGAHWIEQLLGHGPLGGAGNPGLALPVAPGFDASMLPGLQSALLATSVEQRVNISEIAFEMWRQSPIVGIGLGSFLHAQAMARAEPLQLIHTSGLWLLAETGVIGTLLVIGFGLYCVRTLLPERSALSRAALGMIAVFVIGSIGNELMYQRYFWFFLGLALAVPLTTAREQHGD